MIDSFGDFGRRLQCLSDCVTRNKYDIIKLQEDNMKLRSLIEPLLKKEDLILLKGIEERIDHDEWEKKYEQRKEEIKCLSARIQGLQSYGF